MDRNPMKISSKSTKLTNSSRLASDFREQETKELGERFSSSEIKSIRADYRQKANKMEIMTRKSFLEFFHLEELEGSILADRLYYAFSGPGSIDFRKFLNAIGSLAKGSPEERALFMFKAFDLKNKGTIDRIDMKRMLFSLLNSMLEADGNNEIVSMQEKVLALTPQEREIAIEEIIDDVFQTNVLTPEDFISYLMDQTLVRKVLESL